MQHLWDPKGRHCSAPPSCCQEPCALPPMGSMGIYLGIRHAENHSCSAAQLLKAGSPPKGCNQAERATGTEVCDHPRIRTIPPVEARHCNGLVAQRTPSAGGIGQQSSVNMNMCSKTTLGYVSAQFGPIISVPASLSPSLPSTHKEQLFIFNGLPAWAPTDPPKGFEKITFLHLRQTSVPPMSNWTTRSTTQTLHDSHHLCLMEPAA